MTAYTPKHQLQRQLRLVFKGLDFISKHLNGRRPPKATQNMYFNIYQALGLAWEFLGLQCKHWDGYKRGRNSKQVCRICGKIKGVQERYFLVADKGVKRIGRRISPASKKTFANKNRAQLVHDQIMFHGAFLDVDVHNSYKSKLFGKDREITVAADRTVTLKESGIKCSVDKHVIDLKMEERQKGQKPPYGGFPWELSREKLKHFPVILHFDDKYRFLGVTIIRPVKKL